MCCQQEFIDISFDIIMGTSPPMYYMGYTHIGKYLRYLNHGQIVSYMFDAAAVNFGVSHSCM